MMGQALLGATASGLIDRSTEIGDSSDDVECHLHPPRASTFYSMETTSGITLNAARPSAHRMISG